MHSRDFIVRFAGEAGVVTSSDALASAAAAAGYHVYTFATFPSQILGGPIWTQVRISTEPVLSSGDAPDLLVAYTEYGYRNHSPDLRDGGVTIYNSKEIDLPDDGARLGLDVEEMAKSVGNPRATNFVVIGAIAELSGISLDSIKDFNRAKYTRGRPSDEQIISSNNEALELGAEAGRESGISLAEIAPPSPPDYEQVLLNGNEALSLGALTAGVNFYVGYPISPATSILVWMEMRLVGEGRFVHQVSSEIESITSCVGAGFAGAKAMTATAGPGLSLMSEGIGLAWMAEIPLVVVNVQRGGPATGLPTKTEQSDLLTALHPAHGDVNIPIIAPGSVEECFHAAIRAVDWAERYQGPVIVLSEHALSERTQNIPKPDLSAVEMGERDIYRGANGYLRYEAKGLSPMPLPGSEAPYVANGSEHDGWGDTTHLPEVHVHGTERRFGKLKALNDGTFEESDPDAPIVVMPWGASKGPTFEALQMLGKRGVDLGFVYTMFLNPLPEELLEKLLAKKLVIVPELNYQGQWSSVLRSMSVKAESITQYTGLPFRPSELADRIEARVRQHQEETVAV